jgi:colanic acid biosynthesis glycosyl transferase WcaI
VPNQPVTRLPEIYAACDAMYVPLAPGLGDDVMPSKAYQALAAERPIIVAAATGSALATLARESGAGLVVEPLTPEALAATIRSITAESLAEMGRRGREFVQTHYSRPAVSAAYRRLVESLRA